MKNELFQTPLFPVLLRPYLLPLVAGHGVHLVLRDQLLQHPGDHDELGAVRVRLDPEEQRGQLDHVLHGAVVEASQVLGHLLWTSEQLRQGGGQARTNTPGC